MKDFDKNSNEFKKKRNLFYSIAERNSFRIKCGILLDRKNGNIEVGAGFTNLNLLDFVTILLKDMNSFCTLPKGHKEYQNVVTDNINSELEKWYNLLECTFDKNFIKLF